VGDAAMKEEVRPGSDADRLLQLNDEIIRIAGLLAQLDNRGLIRPDDRRADSKGPDVSLEVPHEWVTWLIAVRRSRLRYFSPALFGEPAWDILLDLLRAELAGEQVSISGARAATCLPASTSRRWLKVLEHHGLVLRRGDWDNIDSSCVVLAPEASSAMRRYVLETAGMLDRTGG
jgi:hypothetical protein